MNQEQIEKRIRLGRSFITKLVKDDPVDGDYKTDQELKKPQPPLAKAAMTKNIIPLPSDFSDLNPIGDFLTIINERKSHRVYTDEELSLKQLSYLLWCTQGVKSVRGKAYATIRTVPSGGARHPFECYMAVRKVEGLKPGLYHYLPLSHEIEYLYEQENLESFITDSLCGQSWAEKASVVFYYSCVFYRAEWRYGVLAHAPVLMDSGHAAQNLYLAATSIGLGGCAIASVEPEIADRAFTLDGTEETVFYAMTVGTVRPSDKEAENAFYAFVKKEGL